MGSCLWGLGPHCCTPLADTPLPPLGREIMCIVAPWGGGVRRAWCVCSVCVLALRQAAFPTRRSFRTDSLRPNG